MIPGIKGLHLEPTNICTLKCPGCARTRFIDKWPQHWRNHSLDRTQLMRFLDLDLSGINIDLCGNYGDPIYHPDLIGLVHDFKQRDAIITITTNGSHKKQSWWQELTKELSTDDTVIFSIDGIPENFTQYRVNADWETIQTAIKVCVDASCKTVWKFIPFSYNENNIDQARQLSEDLGIDQFQVFASDRFDEITMHFRPTDNQIGARWHAQQNWKQSVAKKSLNPECHSGQTHFISAEGYYMPCCYTGDHRFYYKTEFGKNKKAYSIQNNTLSKILEKSMVDNFYKNLSDQMVCQYNCGE